MLTALEKQLLNDYQQEFPLTERPFLQIAEALSTREEVVIKAYQQFADQQIISRIGPVITPNHLGASALVAMAVNEEDLETVADLVSSYPNVNHNYERENAVNLWFVLMAEDESRLLDLVAEIEQRSGYTAMRLPMLADFYINLGFQLEWNDVEFG